MPGDPDRRAAGAIRTRKVAYSYMQTISYMQTMHAYEVRHPHA